MRLYDDYRLIGVPLTSQLVRETRLLHNRTYLASNQNRLLVLLGAELLLALDCLVGDHYIFDSPALVDTIRSYVDISERLLRALMDNASPFSVAVLSWFIVAAYSNDTPHWPSFRELFLVGLMASAIDLDHFVAARSLQLGNALNLTKRPFLHNSLTLLVTNVVLYGVTSLICNDTDTPKRVSLMFFLAWWTHHIRDANRRGLWFGPLYTTPPVKRSLYLAIVLILPLVLRYNLINWLKLRRREETHII